jgi:succinate dehydrogenase/fumarate reductase flavoprotein subunit
MVFLLLDQALPDYAAISAASIDNKLHIGVISKVQVMRSHSVSAEGVCRFPRYTK